MMSMALPGVSVIYQGEEIGMTDNMNISYHQTQDPKGCQCGPDRYKECSRDPERTPLQWRHNDTTAGFSTDSNAETWLPINSNYQYINIDTELQDPESHLSVYKAVSKLRREEFPFEGGMLFTNVQGNVFSFSRLQ